MTVSVGNGGVLAGGTRYCVACRSRVSRENLGIQNLELAILAAVLAPQRSSDPYSKF
jgi:hypothetical protein